VKILLMNIDSYKIPNIALKKIEKYHLDRGDEIIWDNELYSNQVDKIYVSCIFGWNKNKCKEWEGIADIGGSGYDVKKVLPKEIENLNPKINIGFTTRGCIRKCPFCIVPQKEGRIRAVADVYDIWDGKSKEITLLDNNIFALPEHFEMIWRQIRRRKLRVDFNQGLDIRLLNDKFACMLGNLRHKEYHFAWDNMKDENAVRKGIKLLKKYNIKRSTFYVLSGFNTNYIEDIYRLEILKSLNQNAFLQRMDYCKDKILSIIARWANQHNCFHKMTFKEFVMHPKHKAYVSMCRNAGLLN